MDVTIHVLDEVNCFIEDTVEAEHMDLIIEKTKRAVDGARHTAAFKIGAWDGKESQIRGDGTTFIHMLEYAIPMLVELGYDVELIDHRPDVPVTLPIDENILSVHGIILRDYQVEAVNLGIDNKVGIIEIGTSGGKTVVCAAILTAFDDKSYTIVPSNKLVNQTYDTYIAMGLNAGKVAGKKKEWDKQHIVCTWQTLIRNRKHITPDVRVVLYDECHIMGDTMFETLSENLNHAYVRLGFTGTVPKVKQKREKILCHLGGEILIKVKPKQMMDKGHVSHLDVNLIPVKHVVNLPAEEWEVEVDYMSKNLKRLEVIAGFISALPPEPRLVLCHPQFGVMLAEELGLPFISDETPEKRREELYSEFKTNPNMMLIASFGTAGTGISIDEITSLVLIDVGKNYTRIVQSIGRGLRLDGLGNYVEVIDIYSDLYKINSKGDTVSFGYSGGKHHKERIKIYKELKYPYHYIGTLEVE